MGQTSQPLRTNDFYYELPEELIAQTPLKQRDSSRLLVLDRQTGSISHLHFRDIMNEIHPGDALVINNSKVIPARLYGKKITDEEPNGADVEFVLLRQREADIWEVLVRPGRRLKPGARICFGGVLNAEILETAADGNRIAKFSYNRADFSNLFEVLDCIGNMPLPPYIKEKLKDKSRYQTVYAETAGSAAAPTAGLHFTEELLEALRQKGVHIIPVMLHVGLGTFRPVKADRIEDHHMHAEYISVSEESAAQINAVRQAGGRIIAVGTTSVRTLESCSDDQGNLHPFSGDTSIFIYPGYRFKIVDAIVTNFHLPESTLLMLISAFASRETVLNAYEEAIRERYRFFSFGDAMFIV